MTQGLVLNVVNSPWPWKKPGALKTFAWMVDQRGRCRNKNMRIPNFKSVTPPIWKLYFFHQQRPFHRTYYRLLSGVMKSVCVRNLSGRSTTTQIVNKTDLPPPDCYCCCCYCFHFLGVWGTWCRVPALWRPGPTIPIACGSPSSWRGPFRTSSGPVTDDGTTFRTMASSSLSMRRVTSDRAW